MVMQEEKIILGKLIITPLLLARASFEDALKRVTDDLDRDGAIQRFEFCLELAWKTMKRILNFKGSNVSFPKDVFREAARANLIDKPDLWFEFIEKRNKTSHIYNELVANEVFAVLPRFSMELTKFIEHIEKL